jgi:type II secretory pathway component GspD/PulD (secretin)
VEIEVVLAEWQSKPSGDSARSEESPPAEAANDVNLTGPTEVIIERVKALEKAGKLAVMKRFRMTTVDGVMAESQIGEQRPMVASVARGGRGGFGGAGAGVNVSSINYVSLGTRVSVEPRVIRAGETAVLKIAISHSGSSTRSDAPVLGEDNDGGKIRAESQTTLNLQTSARVANGSTILLGGTAGNDERQVVLVSVKVVR